MNKKLGLKILVQNPLAVIMEGIRVNQQEYYKKQIASTYNIEKLPTIDLLDLFPDLNETIDPYSFLTGTSLVSDLVLLKSLARKFENCAYLEIGSWRGESLTNVSSVTGDCTSLTLSAAEMRAMNINEDIIKVHGLFSSHLGSVNKVEHNSRTFDFNQLNKKFDLIFIDGDHSYEGVLNDSRKAFPIRKNAKSIIVWHDYSFDPENVRHSTLKSILDGIPRDKHKNLYHVSNTLCAVYIEDLKIPTSYTSFPSYPNKKFSLKIMAEKLKAHKTGSDTT
jgi:hypothetical protein